VISGKLLKSPLYVAIGLFAGLGTLPVGGSGPDNGAGINSAVRHGRASVK
jgi:hypothetical protein